MAELKYKVGDRVRIKNFDWFRNEGANMVVVYMTKYYGEVVTIKSIHKGFYRIKEDGGQYCWIDEMFECKMEEETKPELKFKVGDRIYSKYHKPSNDLEIIEILSMKDGNYAFRIKNHKTNGTYLIWGYEISNYKLMEQETKPKYEDEVNGEYYSTPKYLVKPSGYQFIDENGNVINAQKIILEKKKNEYPKTFEECVSVLMCKGGNRMSLEQMNTFRKLIDARNAYWTIYGIENGLGKPWEPTMETVYCISRNENVMKCSYRGGKSNVLEFPTEEMRDTFYENFKSEIESCKEFL